MAIGRRSRRTGEEDTEVNMVPIMNMFLVLIPFLLMSANFLHLKAINTSVPVQAERNVDAVPPRDAKVTVAVEIREKGLVLQALSDTVAEERLQTLGGSLQRRSDGSYPFEDLAARLQEIKQQYPASDTLLVIPGGRVLYETIIQAMDAGRRAGEDLLFPNVVLSGKVG